jgi:hypothetical protein
MPEDRYNPSRPFALMSTGCLGGQRPSIRGHHGFTTDFNAVTWVA